MMAKVFSRIFFRNGLLAFLALTFTFVLVLSQTADAKVTLKLGTYYSTTDVRYGQTEFFAKQIEKLTGGEVKIVIYPGQQLAKAKEAVNAVAAGAVDMYLPWASHYAGTFPLFDLACQPLLYPTFEKANEALTEVVTLLDEDFKRHGIKVPFAYVGGTFNFFSSENFYKNIEDFKGVKMAGVGGAIDKMLKSFGAGMISITSPERYLGLQRKIVDATITTDATFWSSKLYEVAPYVSVANSPWPAHFLVVNLKKWKSLSDNARKIIVGFGPKMQAHTAASFIQLDKSIYEKLPGVGGKLFIMPDNEKAKMSARLLSIVEQQLKARGNLGLKVLAIIKKYM